MHKRLSSRRNRYIRKQERFLQRQNRKLREKNRALSAELAKVYRELEEAYQSLLLGAETQVLNEELKHKIALLEQSSAEAQQLNQKLQEVTVQTIQTLGELVEGRDAGTAGHCERLSKYALAIAQELGLSEEQREALHYGAYMHDIGKVWIPDSILLKPGRLTSEEYEYMKQHVIFGWKVMSNMSAMEETALIVRHHHEHYDGAGYPDGLAGEQIPITARVLALVDVFDALLTRRPYKEPYPLDEALELIRRETGSHFDPKVVDAFFQALAKGILAPETPDKGRAIP